VRSPGPRASGSYPRGSGTGVSPPIGSGSVSSSSGGSGKDDAICELRLWNLGEDKEFKKIKVNLEDGRAEITMPVFSPDGKSIAVCRTSGSIYLIDVGSGKQLQKIVRNEGSGFDDFAPRIARLAFSPDGKKLAALGV